MDESITKLIVVGQKGVKFPENAYQLRPYCNLALKTFENVFAYNKKCLPRFGRESAKVLMHPIGVELRAVCRTGRMSKRARELLTAAPCANAGLDHWQTCNHAIIEKLTGISNAPIKERIPLACCNFHQLIRCMTDEAEEVKQCTRKTIDFVVKYIHKIIDPILFVLCNEYSEPSDRCDRLVTSTPNRTEDQPIYQSFFLPVIDIAMGLDGKEIG